MDPLKTNTKSFSKSFCRNYEPFRPAMGLLASDESIVVILALNSDMSLVNGQIYIKELKTNSRKRSTNNQISMY